MILAPLTGCATLHNKGLQCYIPERTDNPTLRQDLAWTITLETALDACNNLVEQQ